MAVTWITPPGSPLASPYAPTVFSTSSEIAFVSVSFGTRRTEELAYRDGSFVHPYLESSVNGQVYSLRRTGGWPSKPRVFVEEVVPPISSVWTTLYEKDLRTLPNQVIDNSSSSHYQNFTLDGQPWCLHTGGNGSGQPNLAVKNGVGLVNWFNTNKSNGNPYAGTFLNLRLIAMTGYDPTKHAAVQVRLYRGPLLNVTTPTPYSFTDLVGSLGANQNLGASVWSGGESYGYGPGNVNHTIELEGSQNAIFTRGPFAAVGARALYVDRGPPRGAQDRVRDFVFAISVTPWSLDPDPDATDSQKDRNLRTYYYQRDVFTDALPRMEDMQPLYHDRQLAGSAYANHKLGAYFGIGSGVSACAISHIRVLQKPVVPL